MATQEWDVTITRKSDPRPLGMVRVEANNCRSAEQLAASRVAAAKGGTPADYLGDAEPAAA